jgi:small-conductance mechanosensitive channel
MRIAAILVAAGCLLGSGLVRPALAAQSAPPAAAQTAADPEVTEERPVPVLVSGEPILWISTGIGPYSAQLRADRIQARLRDIIGDRTLRDATVTVGEVDGASELRVGPKLVLVVAPQDAAKLNVPRATLAEQYARVVEEAIRVDRLRHAPATLLRSAGYGLVATLIFAALVWLILRFTRALHRRLAARISRRSEAFRALQVELLGDARVGGTLRAVISVLRALLLLAAFNLYLTYVLGLFPWTRAVSLRLGDYVFTPVRALALAMAGYLPKLLFVVVIGVAVHIAIRLVGIFFRQIQAGRVVFASFPAEWADPTNKIVRVLIIALGLVVAFPYLPASDSPAFAGVSVFMGVLVSLASSSALSNMMAGLVLTYTGAFRHGDRVKVGEAFGDIIETSLLVTRIRTIKNEDITIPNSLVLGTTVTNYTREATTRGLILHTTITIGYDAPWRKIHELLVEAALATPDILREPRPFVWQTSLNDFYVSYEINAYTASPAAMLDTYAALHASIQDAFFAAGVEIMSPHYTSVRDGNTAAIPEAFRGPGYQAPAFRIDNGGPGRVTSEVR